jgi:DNA recombination protein RmuC
MEISYLIIGFFVGGILGAAIVYFVLKSSSVARNLYDELNNNFIKINSDLQNSQSKIDELNRFLQEEKYNNAQQSDVLNQLKNNVATLSAENNAQSQKITEQQELNQNQNSEIRNLLDELQN